MKHNKFYDQYKYEDFLIEAKSFLSSLNDKKEWEKEMILCDYLVQLSRTFYNIGYEESMDIFEKKIKELDK